MNIFSIIRVLPKIVLPIVFFLIVFFQVGKIASQGFSIVLVGAAAIAVHVCLFRHFQKLIGIKMHVLKEHHEFTGFVSTMFASLYGVFLAFTVITTGERFLKAENEISTEVHLISTLCRNAEQFPPAVNRKIREAFRAYMQSVIDDEWPLMPLRKESLKTRAKLDNVWQIYREFKPENAFEVAWYSQSIGELDAFNKARLNRIYARWAAVGPMSWIILIAGALYVWVFLVLFGVSHDFIRITVDIMVISFIAMALYLVYGNQNLFSNPQVITSSDFKMLLGYLQ